MPGLSTTVSSLTINAIASNTTNNNYNTLKISILDSINNLLNDSIFATPYVAPYAATNTISVNNAINISPYQYPRFT
jgi:hypothetical protein